MASERLDFLGRFGSGLVITLLFWTIMLGILGYGLIENVMQGFDEMQGSTLCSDEGCYWNNSLDYCYNGSDQGADCPAVIMAKPLGGMFTRRGVLSLFFMATIFIFLLIKIKEVYDDSK